MTTWITLLRRAIVSVLLAVACVLLLASPGSAHAKTTPANGQRLEDGTRPDHTGLQRVRQPLGGRHQPAEQPRCHRLHS